MSKIHGALLIGYDFGNDVDRFVLTIGKKNKEGTDAMLVNCFYGREAAELYQKLITPTDIMKGEKDEKDYL